MIARATAGRPRALVASSLIVLVSLVGGCGDDDDDGSADAAAPKEGVVQADDTPATNAVTIKDIAFSPAELTVPVGSEVSWTNQDATEHTVTSGVPPASDLELPKSDGLYNGSLDGAGKVFTHTFDQAGSFTYFCSRHPAQMHGTIVVQ